jgi:hypothetical protein
MPAISLGSLMAASVSSMTPWRVEHDDVVSKIIADYDSRRFRLIAADTRQNRHYSASSLMVALSTWMVTGRPPQPA